MAGLFSSITLLIEENMGWEFAPGRAIDLRISLERLLYARKIA